MSSSPKLSVGIHGASGRMGRRLIQLIAEDPDLKLGAALEAKAIRISAKMPNGMVGLAPAGVLVSPSPPGHGGS